MTNGSQKEHSEDMPEGIIILVQNIRSDSTKTFISNSTVTVHSESAHNSLRYPCPLAKEKDCTTLFTIKPDAKRHVDQQRQYKISMSPGPTRGLYNFLRCPHKTSLTPHFQHTLPILAEIFSSRGPQLHGSTLPSHQYTASDFKQCCPQCQYSHRSNHEHPACISK